MCAAAPDITVAPAPRVRLGAVLGINQTLSWGMTFYLPAIIAEPAAAALAQPQFHVLGAFSWSLLVAGFCAPRVGRWIDRHGGRSALLASILVIALGQALLAVSPSLALWYLAWTVIGVGMAMGLYDAAFATIGGLLGQDAGPTITGVTLVAGFASSVFWTLGAALIGAVGWRGLLLGLRRPDAAGEPANDLASGAARPAAPPCVAAPRPPLHTPRQPDEPWCCSGPSSRCAGSSPRRSQCTSCPCCKASASPSNEAVGIAALIGPGQVAGRVLEWTIGPRINILAKARLGALLFPLGAAILMLGGPGPVFAAAGFALLYGMSNGIMTINRGTLPLAMFGPEGYARFGLARGARPDGAGDRTHPGGASGQRAAGVRHLPDLRCLCRGCPVVFAAAALAGSVG